MAAPPTDHYLAVLKASYDYTPQSDDEIPIKEDQILLLIDRVDDDWWKVKVKGDAQDDDGTIGLVPAAYVEPAEHTSVVKALYDYEAAANGELSVHEDDVFYVFEMEEEWVLVQDEKGERAGYVPGNYVEVVESQESNTASTAPTTIVIPDSPPRPTVEYVDPADRVRQNKVTADDVPTWSVSEIDKKGKKKKGTLGIGNGSIFFASQSDKTPVQRWQTKDVTDVGSEKAKHVQIEIGGSSPASLHFHAGSKETAEAIIHKLESTRALSSAGPTPAQTQRDSVAPPPRSLPPPLDDAPRPVKKPSVHFSNAGPDIIPATANGHDDSDVEDDLQEHAPVDAATTAVALYDFTADGDDELSVKEGEHLTVLEKDGDEWWKCRNSKGVEGVVPASYLEETTGATAEEEDDEDDRVNAEAAAAAAAAAEEARKADERAKAAAARKEAERALQEEVQREEKRKQAEARRLEAERKAKEAARLAEERRKRKEEAQTAPRRERPDSSSGAARPSSELSLPSANKVRTWHDRSGQFRVDAEFLGFNNGKLKLHKTNGVIVEVPSEKMSVEDMHFVERLLDKDKKARPHTGPRVSDDDIPLAIAKASTSSSSAQKRPVVPPKKGPEIDWFDFFLSAGCDMDLCTRYAQAFERDKIDESILSDLTEGTLRSLGLKEGDIIRVKKAIQQRKPQDNLVKPNPRVQQQIKSDEELAWQLQQQESQGKGDPPNLFVSGPGGALKQPRRGRPQPTKSVPATVDISAITSPTLSTPRVSSPKEMAPGSARVSTPVSAPARPSSAHAKSGFDDDDQAWAIRPSSTKPQPTKAVSPPPAQPTPPVAPLVDTAPAPAPKPATPTPAVSPPPAASPPASAGLHSLAKTTESDIFDQLARLSELRKSTTPSQPISPVPSVGAPSATTPVTPAGYHAGMGMGPSPVPMGQFTATPPLASPPPQVPYNGPRGPYAPIASNAPLLQPLIPTHTGFHGFVPTTQARLQQPPPLPLPPQRSQLSPPIQNGFGQNPAPFQQPMQTGFVPSVSPFQPVQQQPMLPQQTGMFGNFNSAPGIVPFQQPNGGLNPIQPHMTGFNTSGMGLSPFGNVPPPVPPLPNNVGGPKDNSPANIFAQMKSGTFAMDS